MLAKLSAKEALVTSDEALEVIEEVMSFANAFPIAEAFEPASDSELATSVLDVCCTINLD